MIPATKKYNKSHMNLRDIRIYDTVEDADGKQKRVLNKKGDHPRPAETAGH